MLPEMKHWLLYLLNRAAAAQKQGLFDSEIAPVTTKFVDDSGTERAITVTKDDGIRPGTTLEGLAKLRPAFKPDGSTTAGQCVCFFSLKANHLAEQIVQNKSSDKTNT